VRVPAEAHVVVLFHRGRVDFDERDRLVLDLLRPYLGRMYAAGLARRRAIAAQVPLTARELEVMRLVASGRTNAEIAQALWLSPGTVRKHLEHVFSKLAVHSRTAAVARFLALDDQPERPVQST